MSCSSKKEPPGYWQTHSYTLNHEDSRGRRKAGQTVMWRSAPEARLVPEHIIAGLVKIFMDRKRRREQDGVQPVDNTYWIVMKDQQIEDSNRTLDIKIIAWPWQKHPTVLRHKEETGEKKRREQK